MARFAEEWKHTRINRSSADWAHREIRRRALRGERYDRAARGYYRPVIEQSDGQPDAGKTGVGKTGAWRSSIEPTRTLWDGKGGGVSSTQRIRDAQAAMPTGALIAGWAAAYVHGVDALDGLDHLTLAPLPVPVLLPPGLHRKSTPAIHYRQT